MAWAAGEYARQVEFYRLRGLRIVNRARLEAALLPPSEAPYLQVLDNFYALVRETEERRRLPEEDYPDSCVVVNQNIW
jgi:hypothetical protein